VSGKQLYARFAAVEPGRLAIEMHGDYTKLDGCPRSIGTENPGRLGPFGPGNWLYSADCRRPSILAGDASAIGRDPRSALALRTLPNQGDSVERILEELLLQGNRDALLANSKNGEILHWSNAAEAICGYSRDESLGRLLDDLMVPPDRRNEERRIRADAVRQGLAVYE